jgi:1-acyl-sn-glycerol-3-phosphate acyltransferase
MPLPPKLVRRLLLAPAFIIMTGLVLTTLPVVVIGAAFASRYVPGRWRPLRLLWYAVVWMTLESILLVALFGLWLASGLGWKMPSPGFVDAHYSLLGWFLGLVVRSARRTFGLQIVIDDPDPDHATGRPILVFARHGGPGDSLLLVENLTGRGRRPRIVLKDFLQWDPALDVILNRIPSRFVPTRNKPGPTTVEAISQLAATMEPRDALVIFPEGANFTPRRRTRAIAKLRSGGLDDFADRADQLEHLLPPKPNGVLAAVRGAPQAAIVFVGHSGLENMSTLSDIWTGMRMDVTIETKLWRLYASDLPAGEDDLKVWLYDRWTEMNQWLGSRQLSQPD